MALSKELKYDIIIWSSIWTLVYLLVPAAAVSQLALEGSSEIVHYTLATWLGILPFFLLFLIHHFTLVPLLREKKLWQYAVLTILLIILFGIHCLAEKQGKGPDQPPFPMEMAPVPLRPSEGHIPIDPGLMHLLMGILILGVDCGAFFYISSLRDEQKIRDLQTESIEQQLKSLRYQLNPHFLMNSMNNIHALVDIDPEKAKESIEDLSKMMRVLLYEGDAPTIPLGKEVEFIEHYISLMMLRYPIGTVNVTTSFPDDCSGVSVPPLLLASFIENSFKHGISYTNGSSIDIGIDIGGEETVFRCSNSSYPSEGGSASGIGLENIRKRLSLLYDDSYKLSISDSDGRFDVTLSFPNQPETHTT